MDPADDAPGHGCTLRHQASPGDLGAGAAQSRPEPLTKDSGLRGRLSRMADFDEVWRRIEAHAGETFRTTTGLPHQDVVVVPAPAVPPADPALLTDLADWASWTPFGDALATAPRLPGVYLAREGARGALVYVGMAGERRGQGIRGRLAIYTSGKAPRRPVSAKRAWTARSPTRCGSRAASRPLRAGHPSRAKLGR